MTDKEINEIKISVLRDLYNILKNSQNAFNEDYIIGHLFEENLKLKIEEYKNGR